MTLMLHCGAEPIDYPALRNIQTPEPTSAGDCTLSRLTNPRKQGTHVLPRHKHVYLENLNY